MFFDSFQILHRMCYVGLGIVAGIESTLTAVAADLGEQYAELVARGERDHSALAQDLRHRLDSGLLTVRDIQQRLVAVAG